MKVTKTVWETTPGPLKPPRSLLNNLKKNLRIQGGETDTDFFAFLEKKKQNKKCVFVSRWKREASLSIRADRNGSDGFKPP